MVTAQFFCLRRRRKEISAVIRVGISESAYRGE